MKEEYMSLITEYMDGVLTEERQREFDRYVQEGHINLKEIEDLKLLSANMEEQVSPEPSAELSDQFYSMLAQEKASQKSTSNLGLNHFLNQLFASIWGKVSFAAMVLIVGVLAGRSFSSASYKNEMNDLSSQMTELQEMMMTAMLDEKSSNQRIKGIQMSSSLVNSNAKVTGAMFITLNSDESTNVRLAALRVLSEYADDPVIREGLVNSIAQQDSPIMQVALAELMAELQEKKAIDEFKPIIDGDYIPDDLKTVLQENLDKIM